MKASLITAGAVLLALSLSATAEDMPGMKMDGMNMGAIQEIPPASAEGVIRAIDVAHQTVILAHGPVPALQWPPMTMAFKATTPQLEGLNVGDNVDFEFRHDGDTSKIVSIRKK